MSFKSRYRIIKELGDGSFGCVFMSECKSTKEIVAVKKMKQKYASWEECVNLREVKSLQQFNNHNNIVKLKEVLRERDGTLYFVFEYMEANLYQVIKNRRGLKFSENEIKKIIYQILLGLSHMHKFGYFHRDMKPENLLTNGEIVKIADFGLAREIRSLPPYTEYVSTRWYRAPEIILKSNSYSSPVDIWAVGCIFGELVNLEPMFPGTGEIDQLIKICTLLGPPLPEDIQQKSNIGRLKKSYSNGYLHPHRDEIYGGGTWQEGIKSSARLGFKFPSMDRIPLSRVLRTASTDILELVGDMLNYDPQKRPTAAECLKHPWFSDMLERELKFDSCLSILETNAGSSEIIDRHRILQKSYEELDLDDALSFLSDIKPRITQNIFTKSSATQKDRQCSALNSEKKNKQRDSPIKSIPIESPKRLFKLKDRTILPSICTNIDDLDSLLIEIDNIDSGVSDIGKNNLYQNELSPYKQVQNSSNKSRIHYTQPQTYKQEQYFPQLQTNSYKSSAYQPPEKKYGVGFLGFLKKTQKRETIPQKVDLKINGVGSNQSLRTLNEGGHRTTWRTLVASEKTLLPPIHSLYK